MNYEELGPIHPWNESAVYIYICISSMDNLGESSSNRHVGFHLTPVSVGRSDSVAFDSATELRCVFFGCHSRDQSQGCGGRPPNVKKKQENVCLKIHI